MKKIFLLSSNITRRLGKYGLCVKSCLVCMFLILGGFVGNIQAAETWGGSGSASTAFGGSGTESAPYLIYAQNLNYLVQQVNAGTTYAGKYFRLEVDINLNNLEWIPIGIETKPFRGVFDGNGKIISNLSTSISTYSGFFGLLGTNAVVKNLTLSKGNISGSHTSNSYIGSIAGYAETSTDISRCVSSVDITRTGNYEYVGGIVGYTKGSVSLCLNAGVINSGNRAGGIAGQGENANISQCVNNGAVTAKSSVGGIVGYAYLSINVSGCVNGGKINGNSLSVGYAGGIVGEMNAAGAQIGSSYNYAEVTGSSPNKGGISGDIKTTNNFSSFCYFLQDAEINQGLNAVGTSASVANVAPLTADMFYSSAQKFTGAEWQYLADDASRPYPVGINTLTGVATAKYSSSKPIIVLAGISARFSASYPTYQDMCQASREGSSIQSILFYNEKGLLSGNTVTLLGLPSIVGTNNYVLLNNSVAAGWAVSVSGQGTSSNPFKISTYEQLAAMALTVRRITNYENQYFQLVDNISLNSGDVLNPIGYNATNCFKGIFDGNNKFIYNININETLESGSSGSGALFGYLGAGGVVKNLHLSGGTSTVTYYYGETHAGTIVGHAAANSTIEKCSSSVDIVRNGSTKSYCGGIVGYSEGNVNLCIYNGSITGTGPNFNAGGIAGSMGSTSSITKCVNNAIITGGNYAGGIVGHGKETSTISFCVNNGNVNGDGSSTYVGGIVGYGESSLALESNYNFAFISATSGRVGGVAGYMGNSTNIGSTCYFLKEGGINGNLDGIAQGNTGLASKAMPLALSGFLLPSNFASTQWNFLDADKKSRPWPSGIEYIPGTVMVCFVDGSTIHKEYDGNTSLPSLNQSIFKIMNASQNTVAANLEVNISTLTGKYSSSSGGKQIPVSVSGFRLGNSGSTAILLNSIVVGKIGEITASVEQVQITDPVASTVKLPIHNSYPFVVNIIPNYATDKTVTWSSSNTEVATVDKNGLVVGLTAGTAVITVTSTNGNKTDSRTVNVSCPVSRVTIDRPTISMAFGDIDTLYATVYPENATNTDYIWSSSNENIVKINPQTGRLEAQSVAGTAIITVSTYDGPHSATCTVTVKSQVSQVKLSRYSFSMKPGGPTESITAQVSSSSGPIINPVIVWSSSNNTVATVDQNGTVTAHKGGVADIIATYNSDQTASCRVEVSQTVSGMVTNSDGSIRLSGKVYIFRTQTASGGKNVVSRPVATLNVVNGEFSFDDLMPGSYYFQAIPSDKNYVPGYYSKISNVSPVIWSMATAIDFSEVLSGAVTINIRLPRIDEVLSGQDVEVTGSVLDNLDKSGSSIKSTMARPVAYATVVLYGKSKAKSYQETPDMSGYVIVKQTQTDGDGNFTLGELPQNWAYMLHVEMAGYVMVSTIEISSDSKAQYTVSCVADVDEQTISAVVSKSASTSARVTEALDVKLYPNPVTDLIHVSLDSDMPYLIRIFNSLGQQLVSTNGNARETIVNVSNLKPGIYFVRIESDGKTGTYKIVKQ